MFCPGKEKPPKSDFFKSLILNTIKIQANK